jgi:hypothetical protein
MIWGEKRAELASGVVEPDICCVCEPLIRARLKYVD